MSQFLRLIQNAEISRLNKNLPRLTFSINYSKPLNTISKIYIYIFQELRVTHCCLPVKGQRPISQSDLCTDNSSQQVSVDLWYLPVNIILLLKSSVSCQYTQQNNFLTSPSLDLLFHSPSKALSATLINLLSPNCTVRQENKIFILEKYNHINFILLNHMYLT